MNLQFESNNYQLNRCWIFKIVNTKIISLVSTSILFLFSFFISGCSNPPSSSLGEDSLQKIVSEQSENKINVEFFEKTNGIEREIAGQKIYTMEYSAKIHFQKSGWKSGDAFVGYFNSFSLTDQHPDGWDNFAKKWIYFEKNAIVELTGEIIFEATENGWRKKDFKVKTSQIISNQPDNEYYDQFIGTWSNRNAYLKEITIEKNNNEYIMNSPEWGSGVTIYPEKQTLYFLELGSRLTIYLSANRQAINFSGDFYNKVK